MRYSKKLQSLRVREGGGVSKKTTRGKKGATSSLHKKRGGGLRTLKVTSKGLSKDNKTKTFQKSDASGHRGMKFEEIFLVAKVFGTMNGVAHKKVGSIKKV